MALKESPQERGRKPLDVSHKTRFFDRLKESPQERGRKLAELPYWCIYFHDIPHCEFLRLIKRSCNNTSDCHKKMTVLTSSNGIFFTKNCHDFPFLPYLIRLTNRCAIAQTDAPISIPANMSIKLSLCSSREILFFFMFLTPCNYNHNNIIL